MQMIGFTALHHGKCPNLSSLRRRKCVLNLKKTMRDKAAREKKPSMRRWGFVCIYRRPLNNAEMQSLSESYDLCVVVATPTGELKYFILQNFRKQAFFFSTLFFSEQNCCWHKRAACAQKRTPFSNSSYQNPVLSQPKCTLRACF